MAMVRRGFVHCGARTLELVGRRRGKMSYVPAVPCPQIDRSPSPQAARRVGHSEEARKLGGGRPWLAKPPAKGYVLFETSATAPSGFAAYRPTFGEVVRTTMVRQGLSSVCANVPTRL